MHVSLLRPGDCAPTEDMQTAVFVNGVASCTEQACTGTHLARAESATQAIYLSTVRLIHSDFITAKNPFLLERSNECHFD